jgi:hypothetical protein
MRWLAIALAFLCSTALAGDDPFEVGTDVGAISGSEIGVTVQAWDADLDAVAALGTTGLPARTASNTWALRALTAGSSKISIGNGGGVAGNPTVDAVEANFTLSSIGGSVTDGQVPDTITLSNITQITTRAHGSLSGLTSGDDHPQYLLVADIDDAPVNGEVAQPISSNWAFDHVAAADPHTGYRLESAQISLESEVSGNLPVTNLNSGTSADATTFWRGDGSWAVPGVSSYAPIGATYITQTGHADLTAEQALSSLSSGIMRVATTTGVITSLTDSSGISGNLSDETGTGALVFAGSPTMTGQVSYSSGAAVTAGNYQVGRDADGTNQLHFNVPTGATFEFSVNDATEMTLSGSAVNFQNNSITTTGGGSLTGTWSNLGTVTTIDINGGTVDGTSIGSSSPSSGAFTTVSMTGLLTISTAGSITASTTQTQGQQALTATMNNVSTVANNNDVVTLPAAAAGVVVFIANNGANTLQVFPASGDNIDGAGVNTSRTLASGTNMQYIAHDATNWNSFRGAL